MLHVSRASAMPLWAQVKADVRDGILSGRHPGELIPTESELCERYRVSRAVVRQAISSLVNEGLLYRHQGRGTFLCRRKLEQNLTGARSFSRRVFETGDRLETRLISAAEVYPSERVRSHLDVSEQDPVYRIRRLRVHGDEPIAYQADDLPQRLCPGLVEESANLASIGRALAKEYGLVPARVSVSVECVAADADRAERLQVLEGAPLMVVERVFYLPSGEPMRYSRTRYRYDRFKLEIPAIPLGSLDGFAVEHE